ncbi:MAG TPA: Fe-S cluster assembly protein SufD [Beijerinckiaceae bacterium]|jgi:Fe-S cluster assembly protein SufD
MAEITMMRTPAETALAQAFEAARAMLPGDAQARQQAFSLFSERGLPHRRVEEFKYTDLRAALRDAAPIAPALAASEARAAADAATAFADVKAVRLTLVNGHFVPEASDLDAIPSGVEIVPLAAAMGQGHPLLGALTPVEWTKANPLYQLNAAFLTDGVLIRVPAGLVVETPLHLRILTRAAEAVSTASRVLVVLEDGASLTVLESHEGATGAGQANTVVEAVLGDRASLRHVRLDLSGPEAFAFSTLAAKIGAEARLSTINLVAGSALSRHQVYAVFDGENAHATINGAALLGGRQHADTTLLIDHAAPGGESRELFKTVLDGDATGVFQGKIIVQPRAQKTDGRMMSRALLLGEGATMNNKPELEIFADDVQCGHGATCGALDDDLLFYLMARGLPKADAESLMVQAFVGEAIEAVEHEGAREALLAVIERQLAARAG